MLEEVIRYIKGYRTCYDCGEIAPKKEMTYVEVRDGLLDSKYVWQHEKCTPNPNHHIPSIDIRPFG